jgi:hypothetical protein
MFMPSGDGVSERESRAWRRFWPMLMGTSDETTGSEKMGWTEGRRGEEGESSGVTEGVMVVIRGLRVRGVDGTDAGGCIEREEEGAEEAGMDGDDDRCAGAGVGGDVRLRGAAAGTGAGFDLGA